MIASLFVAAVLSAAPVKTPAFTLQFGGSNMDGVTAVAVAPQNEVVLIGTTQGGWNGNRINRNFVTKMKAEGASIWAVPFADGLGDVLTSVAANSAGAIIVTGSTDGVLDGKAFGKSDAFIASLDATGKQQWVRQYGSAGDDVAEAVFLTARNDIFVAGTSAGLATLSKYDATGKLLWFSSAEETTEDKAVGVIEHHELIYVIRTSPKLHESTLTRYSPVGHQLERAPLALKDAVINAMSAGANETILVAGETSFRASRSAMAEHEDFDAFVSCFDLEGKPVWFKQFGSEFDDAARGIARSASGLIGVTGYTAGPLKGKPAGGTDGFAFFFNDTGKQVGARQFGSKLNDLADSIAVTASGQWVIGGSTSGALQGKSAGADDAFVMTVSP